ncbi:putative DNA packaging protein [Desulfosarcina cetonica]|uniref:terminase small subunit n=1 Tax=Desulfosarcina cetonica TaxID=90730 RepID=UPI0006D04D9D|nr:terminase small subunit [Desulfosarcina cetonica]VTR66758.1 putative DNA packaging protein [Desulfosarcina cetonica]
MKANRSQTAEIFGVAMTTVDTWRKQGCPVESEGGRGVAMSFDTAAVFRWLLDRSPIDGANYTALIEFEKYRKLKRENDVEEQKVAPVSLITNALEKTGRQIIAEFESLPLVLKRNFPELSGDQIQLVKKSIAMVRNAVAGMKIDFLDE